MFSHRPWKSCFLLFEDFSYNNLLVLFNNVLCYCKAFIRFWPLIMFLFLSFLRLLGSVLVNHPTVQSGEISMGRLLGFWHWWQVTSDTWFSFSLKVWIFWFLCYYPHISKDFVCPVWGILKWYFQESWNDF